MAQQPSLPFLTMPHANVRQALRDRIDLAKQIIPRPIRSEGDLVKAEEAERKWRNYNVILLQRLFTTDDFADEYSSHQVHVHQASDPYTDPSVNDLGLRLIETVKRQIATLESVIERVELLYETAAFTSPTDPKRDPTKVFIVHGHDGETRETVKRFVEKLGLEAIILHERPNKGRTIITKFRDEATSVGFAIVLMTPDDVGGVPGLAMNRLKHRARQNVVFEFGFFIGKLGADRVAALMKGDIERPSDLDGVVYISLDSNSWPGQLGRELEAVGYAVDWGKVTEWVEANSPPLRVGAVTRRVKV